MVSDVLAMALFGAVTLNLYELPPSELIKPNTATAPRRRLESLIETEMSVDTTAVASPGVETNITTHEIMLFTRIFIGLQLKLDELVGYPLFGEYTRNEDETSDNDP